MKRIIASLFIVALAFNAAAQAVRPDFLKAGDKVAILSPSYQMKSDAAITRACEVLKEWGLQPVMGEHTNIADRAGIGSEKADHYAGTDEQKVSDMLAALRDPEIKAIICTRGGYGAMRLLDMIPSSEFSEHPKWIVGYSDITAVHAATLKAGVMSVHGNMCGAIGRKAGPQQDDLILKDLLFGILPRYEIVADSLNTLGNATGKLVGGNFITFSVLCGSDYDMLADDEDIILFIEEVEESMHAIDRMFQTLRIHGALSHVKGIIFGDFTDCGNDLPYESVNEMMSYYTRELGIPVAFGFPAGHDSVNLPLIEGATVSLDVRSDGVTISFEGN